MRQIQLDMFSAVLNAYGEGGDGLDNDQLYARVANAMGMEAAAFDERAPIGRSGTLRSPLKRRVRWYQQTLKQAGILQHVAGERGVWGLTQKASKELSQIQTGVSIVGFNTDLGVAILGTCESVFSSIDVPITLCLTSMPYPLAKARRYGNVPEAEYVDWVCKQLEPVVRNLARGGSICLNISQDIFMSQSPARSLYCERLVLALHDRLGLHKMDQLVWENRSKPPGPVQWASKNRYQLNVSWEPIYWFTNDPRAVRSDNRRVLQAHSERHLKLIHQGGEARSKVFSDGAYRIHHGSFGAATAGRIPRNVLSYGHACADQQEYKRLARAAGLPAHGAPMPLSLASFLVEFMTEPDDLVVDPFAGSFTTAKAAELLGRRWLATECMAEYVIGGSVRFRGAPGFTRTPQMERV